MVIHDSTVVESAGFPDGGSPAAPGLAVLRRRLTRLAGPAVLLVAWLSIPMILSGYALTVLAYAGVYAIAAIGLNLLSGHAGQISIGHGTFLAIGSYVAAYAGSTLGLPPVLWLPAAAGLGFLCGLAIGPFALRLSGFYLVIITFAMIVVARYVFANAESVTGGKAGMDASNAIPLLATPAFDFLGTRQSREAGYFWLTWLLVGLVAVITKNILRSRQGRALWAVRQHDLGAAVIGIRVARVKITVFAWSCSMAALAGGIFGCLQGYVNWTDPPEAMLTLSIQLFAMIIIGGMRTAVLGPVLGALFVACLQPLIQSQADLLPFLGPTGRLPVATLLNIIYGACIVAALLLLPEGIVGLAARAKTRIRRAIGSADPSPMTAKDGL